VSTHTKRDWLRLMPLLAGALAVCVYLGSVNNGFTFDDPYIVVENPLVRGERGFSDIFTAHYWAGEEPAGTLYRPLTIASYRLNHDLAGVAPWSYHLVNVLLHGLVTALVFLLARRLTSAPGAAAAAILFAVHPIHTEAVASVVGRAELLSALFVLAAWYWRSRPVAALVLFVCGLLSKENAVVLPGLLLAEDLAGRRLPSGPKEAARRYLAPLAAVGAYLGLRLAVLGPGLASTRGPWVDAPPGPRILTAVEVIGRELWLMVWPATLSADYSYDQIPQVTDPLAAGFLLGLAAIAACAAAAALAWRRLPGVSLGILVFFLALLPTSNLLFGIGVIMAERLLYLPSFGLCLAAGALIATLPARGAPRRTAGAACAVALVLAVPLAARSWGRSADWFDQRSLFEAAARTSPRSALVQVNLGSIYQAEGRLEEAEAAYRRAIGIAPDRPGPHYNLGTILEATGRGEEAVAAYREAVRIDPQDPMALNNLGRSLLAAGRAVEAIAVLERAVAISPQAPTPAVNLAAARLATGDDVGSERLLRQVLAAHPDQPGALRVLQALEERRRKAAEGRGGAGK